MLKQRFTEEQIASAEGYVGSIPPENIDPRVESLVNELIGRVADKWTMLVLEVLTEKGELRFTRLSALVAGISQKMLTQTLRQMERDGLITRTVHPVVPPKVEYKADAARLEPGSSLLRRMDLGGKTPRAGRGGTQRIRSEVWPQRSVTGSRWGRTLCKLLHTVICRSILGATVQ
jgi:DNA-binding HxlR family transcriptional regulator